MIKPRIAAKPNKIEKKNTLNITCEIFYVKFERK